jgi:hypothetical protein
LLGGKVTAIQSMIVDFSILLWLASMVLVFGRTP